MKMMKRYFPVVMVICALSIIFASPSFALNFRPLQEAQPEANDQASDQANVDGQWYATVQWSSGGTVSATWTINQTGPLFSITSTTGAQANGITFGPLVVFRWKGGCVPIYFGRASGDSMSGRGFCTTSDAKLTWQAERAKPLPSDEPEDYVEGDATEINP